MLLDQYYRNKARNSFLYELINVASFKFKEEKIFVRIFCYLDEWTTAFGLLCRGVIKVMIELQY
jgi:hypothetical protein